MNTKTDTLTGIYCYDYVPSLLFAQPYRKEKVLFSVYYSPNECQSGVYFKAIIGRDNHLEKWCMQEEMCLE